MNAQAFAGAADWRVPTKDELLGIVNCSFSHCIDPVFGPTTASFGYWSSSVDLDPNSALVVFFPGGVNTAFKVFPGPVRAVRGGP